MKRKTDITQLITQSDQPEWFYHYQRYEQHKDEYPLTTSEISYFIEYKRSINITISKRMQISSSKETREECAKNADAFNELLYEESKRPLCYLMDEYDDGTVHFKPSIVVIERHTKCPNCGCEQIINLSPLSVDLDFWICKNCENTFSHVRPGMENR